ncbi:related to DUF453 domain protein [Fusarium mangiferae]|uniref:Related to DUF453 domain protein n=1 Tax=Fusarium mangiferae TaxID=192010 RepID=A0A1L7TYE6_FUSMA|nr:uncharacterized protein FMAN_09792 [Fusarium mangiferae]CVL00291.1 related to DUF453 domain protein [Fusarium mangiferae]
MPRLHTLRVLCKPQVIRSTGNLHLAQARKISTFARQNRLAAAYYRGGSSRAVFFKSQDLPPADQRDGIFLNVVGSPDPYGRQLDGMGGGISSLSKVCIVGPPTHPDADVDYTFVSLGIKNDKVDYSSNCGNMSAAVGPFAVDSGLVSAPGGSQERYTVRIHNTNTGKIINASFPTVDGEAAASGDFAIDGVAGTAAPVQLDFVKPAGSRTGKLLPTGSILDTFDGYKATCIDVGNPCVFVNASELGIDGELSSDDIEDDTTLKAKLESIRRQAAIKMGLAQDLNNVPGSVPKIAIASPRNKPTNGEVNIRAMSVGQAHKAVPVTVALATAAAAKLPGSTIAKCLRGEQKQDGLDICHASGRLRVDASFDDAGELTKATVFRTARRLMDGLIYWK